MVKTHKELAALIDSHSWMVINKLENIGHPDLSWAGAMAETGRAVRLNTAYGLKTTVEIDPNTLTIRIS